MYTVFLTLVVTLVAIAGPLLLGASAAWTTLPGILVGGFTFVWVSRRIAKRVEAVTQASEQELSTLQQIMQNQKNRDQARKLMDAKFDKARGFLEQGFLFAKWQFGVTTMLNARIGILHFSQWMVMRQIYPKAVKGRLAEAIPYLEASQVKGRKGRLLQALWPAWVMLAVAHYKGRKDLDRAIEVLENTTKVARKHGIVWAIYAWILWTEKRSEKAIEVLIAARQAAPDDKRITQNLSALQNGKKMSMKGYGEQWFQFGLEKPKMQGAQAQMGHPRMRARGGRRR